MGKYKVDPSNPLPRYYQVYISLKDRIFAHELAVDDALPSERQLAIDYGVSRITIVKALDLLVNDNLIERQHGRGNFVQDISASTQCTEDCRIALCIPTLTEAYIDPEYYIYSENYMLSVIFGAMKTATSRRIQMQIVEIGEGEEEINQIRRLIHQGLNGLILYSRSTLQNVAFYQEIKKLAFPFVMIDRYSSEVQSDYVVHDDENAAYCLTKSLIEAGHSQIALFIGAEKTVTAVQNRIKGYSKALEDHGIKYNPQFVGETIYEALNLDPDVMNNLKTSYTSFIKTFQHDLPTAVLSLNANVAERTDAALSKIQIEMLHLVINADKKYINYDLNISQAAFSQRQLNLNLTPLVAQAIPSSEDLGARAVELLLDRIFKRIPETPQEIVLPMHIQTFT